MDEIKFDDWKKLDIRVGKVLEVKDHPEAEKLYVLKVDFGEFERWIVSGLREHYTKEEIVKFIQEGRQQGKLYALPHSYPKS